MKLSILVLLLSFVAIDEVFGGHGKFLMGGHRGQFGRGRGHHHKFGKQHSTPCFIDRLSDETFCSICECGTDPCEGVICPSGKVCKTMKKHLSSCVNEALWNKIQELKGKKLNGHHFMGE
ncbi:hypothetical protein SNEBB_007188 [Seison nebaliae]|nr:hypothetical protein SNEBB_007188 [Seison nebaliae]